MDDNSIDEILRKIALEHNVTLGREDPILILHTMNKIIIEENRKNQDLLFKDLGEKLGHVMVGVSENSKSQVEKSVNAALTASKEISSSIIDNSSKVTIEKINDSLKKAVDNAIEKIDSKNKAVKNLAYVNLVASAMVLITAVVLVLGFTP